MAKISDLGLTNEQVGEALDYPTMQDQFGSFPDPPPPGSYRFRFPNDLSRIWEIFDHPQGKPPGKRLRAKFDESFPLTIIQSPGGEKDGEPFQTAITNAEWKRGKAEDANAQTIADMDYFNRDVWGLTSKPTGGNKGYADEFQKHAGTEFGADVEWSWACNDKRNIYVPNGSGGYQEVNQLGCGTKYRQRDVDKVHSNPEDPSSPLVYPLRIQCQCGAHVRAFANLTRFRP